MPFIPRPFQAKFCKEIAPHWRTRDKALCALGMGGGKTHMTMYLFSEIIKEGGVWVVLHDAGLVLQWFAAALEHNNLPSDVSIIATKFVVPELAPGIKDESSIEARANKRLGLRVGSRFVIAMVKQIEKSLPQADFFGLMPKYVVIDEFHRVRWHEGCRQLLVAAWKNDPHFKTLALTGTPVSHEANTVQVKDHIDPRDWFVPATNAEMIEGKFWSRPEYLEISDDYMIRARDLFKGLKVDVNGEISGTSQSAVMQSLLPEHVEMISALDRRHGETFLVFCATTAQAERMAQDLTIATGELWLAPNSKGDTKDNPKILAAMSSGEFEGQAFRGACAVGMWIAGTDIPRCCTVVFACVKRSLPEFLQAAGRGVRIYKGLRGELKVSLSCRFLDLGLNFDGQHPRLEHVDFRNAEQWEPIKFADAHTLMCQNPGCLFVHKRIPTPKHPRGLILGQPWSFEGDMIDACTGKVIKAPKGPPLKIDLLTGIFSDGILADQNEPLQCIECGAPVMGALDVIAEYVSWKKGETEDRPQRMGITIGLGGREHMTLAKMWECGLWAKLEEDSQGKLVEAEGEAEGGSKDNSEDWEFRRQRVKVYRSSEAARAKRTKVLSSSHQRIANVDDKELRAIAKQSPEKLRASLRRAMLKAYVDSKSPLDAMAIIVGYGSLQGFPGLSGPVIDREIALLTEAFEGVYTRVQAETPSRTDCYQEFEAWITYYLDEAEQLFNLSVEGSIQHQVLDRRIEQLSPLLKCVQQYEAVAQTVAA